MKGKSERLSAIKTIIKSQPVGSQEELLNLLEKNGFLTTQATLSRDLKQLQVAKVPHPEKGYIYELPKGKSIGAITKDELFPMAGIESIDFSGNLAVMKTQPGFANGIASIIDNNDPFEILGTIAGDDTILLITREGISRPSIINALVTFLPGLKNKIV